MSEARHKRLADGGGGGELDPTHDSGTTWRILLLLILLSYVYGWGWDLVVRSAALQHQHDGVLSGKAMAPFRYRILTPYLAEGIRIATGCQLRDAYRAVHTGSAVVFLLALHFLCRRWLGRLEALIPPLLITAIVPWTYRYRHIAVTDSLNLSVVTLSLLLLQRRRDLQLLWLLPIGFLNRESASTWIPGSAFW